ncbi:acetyl-CoA carboxylase carboxyl transferase subunit alpha [Kurthia huakuii]|uniref:acetyl-CoA carboxylase carboxyl transferase subunit alpha n=1 Tax=Kurthia huakuii TaxID=1421019 RepID=UPI0004965F60|nr:acetyl-CoA carboxylase carboxyl transferase subunit alpha [Kurthia huakuii]MBM7697788.1 acetyl-CoA carboxylase carboxyl transferase subunit alpha [Kurthia huakuii]
MAKQPLAFEKPLIELRAKIDELKNLTTNESLDFSEEIEQLEQRFSVLEKNIYTNLKPWDRVQVARMADRPTTLEYVEFIFDDFIELHGDRQFGDDAAIVSGIASLNGVPVTIIGHQRGRDTKENVRRNFGMPHPEGYRKALRLMKQAEKFNRPVICFIDTKGAYPGSQAEMRGQSEAIARNLVEMAGLTVPVISVVIGEGGSGGALALGVANRLHMLTNSTFSVISPEGAASILWRDGAKAQQAAEAMRITAPDLKDMYVIDEIIPEVLGGAQKDPEQQAEFVKETLEKSLTELLALSKDELIEDRYKKYREIGIFTQ